MEVTELLGRYTATLETYREGRQHIFATDQALRLFLARHRKELVESKALIFPARSYMLDPEAFDHVVESIGERRASSPLSTAA